MAADGSLKFDTKIDTADFDSSISTLEKALDRLSESVDKLSDRIVHGFGTAGRAAGDASEKMEAAGDSASGAAKDVEAIGDAARESERQTKSLREQMEAIEIHDWQENMAASPGAPDVNPVPVDPGSMQYDPGAMAAVFGEAAAEIRDYAEAVSQYGAQAGSVLNGMGQAAAQAAGEVREAAADTDGSYVSMKDSVANAVGIIRNAIMGLPGTVANGVASIPGIVKGAFSTAANAATGFGRKLGSAVSGGAKLAAAGLKSLVRPANKASTSILKLSNMMKLMVIRMAMRAALQGVRDGLKNLAQYSSEANRSISGLMTGMTYLKNSFAAAFSPILTYVAPVLNTLIDLLATALNYVNQFLAALGGSATFIRAKKVNEDYAKSLKATGGAAEQAGKDAKKALAPFDELTVLQDQASSGSGGGGAGGADPSGMFETVAVDNAVNGFAEQIRQAFEAGDWKGLGTLIGNKFNETVDGIDWGGMGHKMGYGINGAVQTAYYTLKEADFAGLGNHVADLMNGGMEEIDFTFVGRLWIRKFTLALDFFLGLLGGLNWGLVGKSVGDSLRGAFEESYDWITGIDWSRMAHNLYSNIKDFLLGVDFSSLAESFFKMLGAALGAAVSFIASFVGGIWNDITGYFSDYLTNDDGTKKCGTEWVAGILDGILDAIIGVGTWIWEHVAQPLVQGFKDAFGINSPSTVMAELGGYLIEGLMGGITSLVPNLLDTISELVGNMKQKLSEIITYVGSEFKNGWETAWNGVKDVFRGVFNGIISILETALNFIVNGINKLGFDVPEWVPGIGGSSFGFDIEPFSLPRLASGTVVPPRAGEFAAILGDNNREAEVVSPISTMKQAFREILEEMQGMSGGDINLTVNLDGKPIYEDVIKRNRMAKKQTGKNPLLV